MQNITYLMMFAGFVILWGAPFAKTPLWRALITPLASIIGSGFLIIGPILGADFGIAAPIVMSALCMIAFGFGHAIRTNIAYLDANAHDALGQKTEIIASWVLGFAYVISITYYLNLFGAFSTELWGSENSLAPRLITSAIFTLILIIGWTRGFHALETMEKLTVSIKLAIILGLLAALAFWGAQNGNVLQTSNPTVQSNSLHGLFLVFGLLVTVQGFETSRYMGQNYSATTRIMAMKWAQIGASMIYVLYVALLINFLEMPQGRVSETEIIDLMGQISVSLPFVMVTGALAAQFSAAIADTAGGGGLFVELTHNRISYKSAYAAITLAGLVLTWSADIFTIISFASRAFAVYYALQSFIAARIAWNQYNRPTSAVFFAAMAILGTAIAFFGLPIE